MDDLILAAEFPAATREQWLAAVERVLKGASFETLVSHTPDGLRIEPLYPKAEGAHVVGRRETGPWRVMARVDHPDPAAANSFALADLEGGADALALVFDGAPTARGFGLRAGTVEELDHALGGVMLDLVAVRVESAPFDGDRIIALWRALAQRRGLAAASLSVDAGLDPIGDLQRTGSMPAPWPEMARSLSRSCAAWREAGFRGRPLRVDGRPVHEAGGSEAQELAAALATGVAYLRALEADGQDLGAARSALTFLLAADADEFLTIAKFRALRRLWSRVEEACGLAPEPIVLQVETAWRMTTRRDPWVNLLRATIATFASAAGGADAITVLPFTAALGLPDGLARRIARNTQLVLLEEANLARVADPAAGAGGFEALTDALCERAWTLFQELEREGGIVASLAAGAWQGRIAAVRARRAASVATGQDPITGTSAFPDLREAAVAVLMPSPLQANRPTRAETTRTSITVEPLPSVRLSEPFERLREVADARLAQSGSRPRAFLAILGTDAGASARTAFARTFFEAGGIETISGPDGSPDHAALAAACRASGTALACLCGSDAAYAEQGVATAEALRAAGCRHIVLAGRPGAMEEKLRQAGVQQFIFTGCDRVQGLMQALAAA